MVDWKYYKRFKAVNEKYLPDMGEGETMATQIATAVNKLVYKWYNDGDVYDNTGCMTGWANDLSSYANWLREYTDTTSILDGIWTCYIDDDDEMLLKTLADRLLDDNYLEQMAQREKVGSVYDAEGPYRFEWHDDEEEEEW